MKKKETDIVKIPVINVIERNEVQFSSIQDDVIARGKAHMRSVPSLRSLLTVARDTVPILYTQVTTYDRRDYTL